ncbi:piggyBac transposable element-derived protein 3-like [Diabrotica virgifera virgifera]|uniref:PiggyBac transposable element-derived protein domain-containing protein n=1 Tax=Diabrotica virgifera virgifera TaxID=50390 RepID=A0ABM5KM44_DIAVI|nr:piggyBac transposable element-derived protein 3-like [Diabrotica virgifera virgifera]XP_050511229.1 piggyBac transposable element-derived protein 3-like [Diabrotica virgifera virgifera]
MLFTDSKRIQEYVDDRFDGDNSEVDISDDDDLDADPTWLPQQETTDIGEIDEEEEEDEETISDGTSTTSDMMASNITTGEDNTPVAQAVSSSERYFWKKNSDFEPCLPAPDNTPLEINAVNLQPHAYVSKYIPESIFKVILEQTNRTYVEKTGKVLLNDVEDVKKFFSASLMMSIMGYPRIRMYWARKTKAECISNLMRRDKYFCIRKNLKIVYDGDVTDEEKNAYKFWKVEPLIRSVKTGCLLNPKPQVVAIDEQMIPFWGHCPARQVIKTKPNPCGLKNFVVAAPDGLPLDFFFYQGKGDPIVHDERFKLLDVGGKAVMKLLTTFPPGVSIYMDRYFNSEHLLDLLHSEREATGTGTLKQVRIPKNSKLRSDTDLKKEGRGAIDESVRSDGQVSVVKWFDNRAVILMSNREGSQPVDKCRRWCKIQKRFIEVNRPLAVKVYNANMGGIDFLDRMISYYRISARTRKWTVRVIMHLFDFAISASWIEYRRDQRLLGTHKKDIMDLFCFKEEYAYFLAHGHQESSEDSDPDYECSLPPHRKQPRVSHPPDLLRKKHTLHLPEIPTPAKKNRCRMPGCSANSSRIRCSTCQVFLCIQENRNCFKLYHEL